MKLWVISQDVNGGYDTYDSAVVAAETEDTARLIYPGQYEWNGIGVSPALKVKVEYIGEAKEGTAAGVIVASFNAG